MCIRSSQITAQDSAHDLYRLLFIQKKRDLLSQAEVFSASPEYTLTHSFYTALTLHRKYTESHTYDR